MPRGGESPREAERPLAAERSKAQSAATALKELAAVTPPPVNLLFLAASAACQAAANAECNEAACLDLAKRIARLEPALRNVSRRLGSNSGMKPVLTQLREHLDQCRDFMETFRVPDADKTSKLKRVKAWIHRHSDHEQMFQTLHDELSTILHDAIFASTGVVPDKAPTIEDIRCCFAAAAHDLAEMLLKTNLQLVPGPPGELKPPPISLEVESVLIAHEVLITAAPLARVQKGLIRRLVGRTSRVVEAVVTKSRRGRLPPNWVDALADLKVAIDNATQVCDSLAPLATIDQIDSVTRVAPDSVREVNDRLRRVVEELTLDVDVFDADDDKDDRNKDTQEMHAKLAALMDQGATQGAEQATAVLEMKAVLDRIASALGMQQLPNNAGAPPQVQQPIAPWLIDWDDIVIRRHTEGRRKGDKKEIGQGSFGRVYDADYKGHRVAVKVLVSQAGAAEAVAKEVAQVFTLRHPNIVHVFGGTLPKPHQTPADQDEISVVMQFIDGYTLDHHIFTLRTAFTVAQKLNYSIQLLNGLQYLHGSRPRVVHRDLKPPNVMITADLRYIVIIDFGLAVEAASFASFITRRAGHGGTEAYAAPEVHSRGRVNEKCDVFSAAATLVALWTGRRLWPPTMGGDDIYAAAISDQAATYAAQAFAEARNDSDPALYPAFAEQALKLALHIDPAQRPSAARLAMVLLSFSELGFPASHTTASLIVEEGEASVAIDQQSEPGTEPSESTNPADEVHTDMYSKEHFDWVNRLGSQGIISYYESRGIFPPAPDLYLAGKVYDPKLCRTRDGRRFLNKLVNFPNITFTRPRRNLPPRPPGFDLIGHRRARGNRFAWTSLHVAVASNDAAMIRHLAGKGAVSLAACKDWRGQTALHIAAARGHSDCVAELLRPEFGEYGTCDKDALGRVPLALALDHDRVDLIPILSQNLVSADFTEEDATGQSLFVRLLAVRFRDKHKRSTRSLPDLLRVSINPEWFEQIGLMRAALPAIVNRDLQMLRFVLSKGAPLTPECETVVAAATRAAGSPAAHPGSMPELRLPVAWSQEDVIAALPRVADVLLDFISDGVPAGSAQHVFLESLIGVFDTTPLPAGQKAPLDFGRVARAVAGALVNHAGVQLDCSAEAFDVASAANSAAERVLRWTACSLFKLNPPKSPHWFYPGRIPGLPDAVLSPVRDGKVAPFGLTRPFLHRVTAALICVHKAELIPFGTMAELAEFEEAYFTKQIENLPPVFTNDKVPPAWPVLMDGITPAFASRLAQAHQANAPAPRLAHFLAVGLSAERSVRDVYWTSAMVRYWTEDFPWTAESFALVMRRHRDWKHILFGDPDSFQIVSKIASTLEMPVPELTRPGTISTRSPNWKRSFPDLTFFDFAARGHWRAAIRELRRNREYQIEPVLLPSARAPKPKAYSRSKSETLSFSPEAGFHVSEKNSEEAPLFLPRGTLCLALSLWFQPAINPRADEPSGSLAEQLLHLVVRVFSSHSAFVADFIVLSAIRYCGWGCLPIAVATPTLCAKVPGDLLVAALSAEGASSLLRECGAKSDLSHVTAAIVRAIHSGRFSGPASTQLLRVALPRAATTLAITDSTRFRTILNDLGVAQVITRWCGPEVLFLREPKSASERTESCSDCFTDDAVPEESTDAAAPTITQCASPRRRLLKHLTIRQPSVCHSVWTATPNGGISRAGGKQLSTTVPWTIEIPTMHFYLGVMYADGVDVPCDLEKAARYFHLCTKQNDDNVDHTEALYRLGRMYEQGWGVPKDLDKARDYYAQSAEKCTAAELGDPAYDALLRLCLMHDDEQGNLAAEAVPWYTRYATAKLRTNECGEMPRWRRNAGLLLGRNGRGTQLHLRWLPEAITKDDEGHEKHESAGREDVAVGEERSLRWIRIAAEKSGDPRYLYLLGTELEDRGQGREHLLRAALAGNADSQLALGNAYSPRVTAENCAEPRFWHWHWLSHRRVRGDVPEDLAEALRWYLRAASSGNREVNCKALECLAELHCDDTPEPIPWSQDAREWFVTYCEKVPNAGHCVLCAAADITGDPTFAFRAAQHYEHGTGGANKRNHKAVDWYETAAAGGHREAQRHLGELYLEGRIVKKDVWRAVGYLQSAADQGDEIALRTLRIQSAIQNARDAYEDDDGDDG
jgi:TPR repeat protein/serine/threonine protein kinase